jgi:mannonate dehydratase
VPAAIRRFGKRGKIHFAHVRDVRGTPERFVETFHDEGPTDMLACMRAYREVGAEVPMRVRPRRDPGRRRQGRARATTTLGVLFAVGYLTGVREAAYADPHRSSG